jgi:hypothetical protein
VRSTLNRVAWASPEAKPARAPLRPKSSRPHLTYPVALSSRPSAPCQARGAQVLRLTGSLPGPPWDPEGRVFRDPPSPSSLQAS